MGFLKSAVGVKGWLKIKANTEEVDSLLQYPVWYVGNAQHGFHAFELEDGFLATNGLQVKLKGVNDRTAAEKLRGSVIAIPREEFLPTEQDEYYWVDLVGLKVINHHKEIIGEVMGLMETGANDVLVVSAKSERKKTLIPFVDVYIQSVDIEKGVMTVDWELDY
ncbi:ribosome maturation factor RimM [Neisseriaceae bacterium PsAf]|nr:ribosome maturation factor RimM [Neisseriaceae bacterium PsAf]MCV2502744.1 ribosome maturation factor RimM [Neisseriaceae bacterium]